MTWHENIEDFGEEIAPGSTFQFECHPGLGCFGKCCATDITLTPYDIARLRRHLGMDTHRLLSTYCLSLVDTLTGFPFVLLNKKENGSCVFLGSGGCDIYENRPSCCRNYPLARVIENNALGTRYYLQRHAEYCEGFGRGRQWTAEEYCEHNGLGPYEKANDLFLQIPFAFEAMPLPLRHDKQIQTMIYQAVFDFDRFFEQYGRFGSSSPPEDDFEMIASLTNITLNLIRRSASLKPEESPAVT